MTTNEESAAAMADLAANYRLGLAELEKLRDALAPAFALGLQQAAESPARWPELSRLFFAGPWPARDPKVGDGLLDLFFVSPALRDAVSRQASSLTGLAPALVAEMMPRLAALGVEAMMRGAMAPILPRPAAGLPADEFGRLAAEMMRRGANAVEALSTPAVPPRPAALPTSPFQVFDMFGEAMRATLGASAAPPPNTARPSAGALDPQAPFAAMFDAFARGMRMAAAGAGGAPAPAAPPESVSFPDPGLVEAFLGPGRRIQENYLREMADLFRRVPGAAPGGSA